MTPEEIAASALAKLNSKTKDSTSKMTKPRGKQKNDMASEDPASSKNKTGAKKPAAGGAGRRTKQNFKYPVEPVVVTTVPKVKGVLNHSYRDFSNVPPEMDYQAPTSLEDMTFAEKVHHILSDPENAQVVRWLDHGRSFQVMVPVVFERTVCSKYFGHKRYSSFLRQLNNHGFKHLTKGADRNSYYHECMIKNMPHLCKYMPEPKDARRQIPDPDKEPDFYEISRKYPVPDRVGETGSQSAAAQADVCQAVPSPETFAGVVPQQRALAPAVMMTATTRLASEVPWMIDQLPPAKRLALGLDTISSGLEGTMLLHSQVAAPQAQLSIAGMGGYSVPTAALGDSSSFSQNDVSPFEAALIQALREKQAQQQQSQQFRSSLGFGGGGTTPPSDVAACALAQFLRLQQQQFQLR